MHVNMRFVGRLRWAGGLRGMGPTVGSGRVVQPASGVQQASTNTHWGPGPSLECFYLCGMEECITVHLPCIIEMQAFVVWGQKPPRLAHSKG